MNGPHLLVSLSGHGYGHLAQAAPVLNALAKRLPHLRLTIESALEREVLARRIDVPFEHRARVPDVGMVMRSALDVDVAASIRAYDAFHRELASEVAAEARLIADVRPDLVLADVPYRVLAAARQAGARAVGLCSLRWTEIYSRYCGDAPRSAAILEEMEAAYRCADLFVRPEPAMPMRGLPRVRTVGPIVRPARPARETLRERLGVDPRGLVALIALGGVPMRLGAEAWPRTRGVVFLVPEAWGIEGPGLVPAERLGLHMTDLLASCDVVIAKPGYNTFVEAASSGVPVLYVARPDWPEEPYLTAWLRRVCRCRELSRARLEAGDFLDDLRRVAAEEPRAPVAASGAGEAADILVELLAGRVPVPDDATAT